MLLLLVAATAVAGKLTSEDDLHSVQLDSSSAKRPYLCIVRDSCSSCHHPRSNNESPPLPAPTTAECEATGFVQRLECFDNTNMDTAEPTSTLRWENCEPSLQFLDFFQFNLACLLFAAVSLYAVHLRKNAARQNLVQLVNRS